MSSIFRRPEEVNIFPFSALFLHGLEGSPSGSKATHLRKKWGAKCPLLRTANISELKSSSGEPWSNLDLKSIDSALEPALEDARTAYRYTRPDIVIGSSMGGALLMKLVIEGSIDPLKTSCIFLAPAIEELVRPENVPSVLGSTWVFGEMDNIIDNRRNVLHCLSSGGNLLFSPGDDHRLRKATSSGLVDAAILTSLSLKEYTI